MKKSDHLIGTGDCIIGRSALLANRNRADRGDTSRPAPRAPGLSHGLVAGKKLVLIRRTSSTRCPALSRSESGQSGH
jgi:hypothetical protein